MIIATHGKGAAFFLWQSESNFLCDCCRREEIFPVRIMRLEARFRTLLPPDGVAIHAAVRTGVVFADVPRGRAAAIPMPLARGDN